MSGEMVTGELVVVALGVARLTVLVTIDRVTRRQRWWVARRFGRDSYAAYLVDCPWCAGFWIALVATGAWLLWPTTVLWLLPWAVAFVASALASHLAGSDPPPPDVPQPDPDAEPF